MIDILIPETGKHLYMPEELGECDSRQYIAMCALIMLYQSGKLSYEHFKTEAVYTLLNLHFQDGRDPLAEANKVANIEELCVYVENFFETNTKGDKVIYQGYTNNPVPVFKHKGVAYYGPSDHFDDMTFGEYKDALRIFHDFHATSEVTMLYLLVAIFYRPRKRFAKLLQLFEPSKLYKQPYNAETFEQRANALKDAPIGFIYGVYLLFASFQKYLVEAKIMWSGQELDLSILFDASPPDKSPLNIPSIGMDSIAFSLAESQVFGDYEKVCNMNFWTVIVKMYDLRRQSLEIEKNTKK